MGAFSGIQGSINNCLAEWWGGDTPGAFAGDCWSFAAFSAASNLFFGGNPPYQLSDFLATYPKFGIGAQALMAYALGGTMTGYAPGDTLTIVQAGSAGALITVNTVDSNGAILTSTLTYSGTGYSVATGLAITTSGAGTGALVNITQVSASNLVGIPPLVLQLYINLAATCLQKTRWDAYWPLAMGWFVAHYATLYLRSEGSTGTTPGQIAAGGLTRGIMVSKSAGGVSAGIAIPSGMEEWGAWQSTEYGLQLATVARVIGMGPMYAVGGPTMRGSF